MDSTQDILDQTRKIEREAPLNTRLILYLLNPADYIGSQYKQVSQRWEIWSFSKKDSREYGFKYGNTFYFRELVPQKTIPSIQYDSVFIGLDKRRKQSLKEIRYMYRSAGIIPFFYIVDNVKRLYNKQYKKRISYEDVVKLVMDSKSITEVLQQNQDGMTLRTMESIFLKRKIITTNPSIKTQRIYHPNNVFVLGEDDIKHLYDFVNTPYTEIDEKEVNKYLFSSWLQRIINNEEFE
jgi:hypothetical protein